MHGTRSLTPLSLQRRVSSLCRLRSRKICRMEAGRIEWRSGAWLRDHDRVLRFTLREVGSRRVGDGIFHWLDTLDFDEI